MKYDGYDYDWHCTFTLNNGEKIYAGENWGDNRQNYLTTIFYNKNGDYNKFTQEERKEIAEYMTQLWKEWANG